MLLSWHKRQCGGQSKASSRPASRCKFRPLFETLENRVMLSVTTINVTSAADLGGFPHQDGPNLFDGTLRQAINEANLSNNADGYLIKLQAHTTYFISSGGGTPEDTNAVGGDFDLTSLDAVTIQGANGPSGGSIIDGNNTDRVFDIATGASNLITFDTLTIQHGSTTGDGGGMRTAPGTMVKLTNVIVQENFAGNNGGGIAAGFAGFSPSGGSGGFVPLSNKGSLTIVGSRILNNRAEASGVTSHGGGIAVKNETANISGQSLISGNTVGAGFSGGRLFGEGGGLYTGLGASGGSNVTVDNSTISGNTAFGDSPPAVSRLGGEGGGAWIGPGDTLTVQNGSVIGGPSGGQNTAAAGDSFGGKGGGIYGEIGSTVNVNGSSTVSYNLAGGGQSFSGGGKGGGLYSEGIVKLNNSTVQGNQALASASSSGGGGGGGGIFALGANNPSGSSVSIRYSTIDGNSATAGEVSTEGNAGGGVALISELATILSSTISNNHADGGIGGGIFADGRTNTVAVAAVKPNQAEHPNPNIMVTNSTIANNTAKFGGGFYNFFRGVVQLTNDTVAFNQVARSGGGGGVDNVSATVIVWNTIIARNTFGPGGPETDVTGTPFTSLGHNLIGLVSSAGHNGFTAMGDQISTDSNHPLDPGLNPLGPNGGPTLTCSLKLQPKSPAIDAGDDNAIHFIAQAEGVSDANATDQRGPGFPRKLGRHIDIGAFEARASIRPGGDQ